MGNNAEQFKRDGMTIAILAVSVIAYGLASWPLFRFPDPEVVADAYLIARICQLAMVILLSVWAARTTCSTEVLLRWTPVAAGMQAFSGLFAVLSISHPELSFLLVPMFALHGMLSAVLYLCLGSFFASITPRSSAAAITIGLLSYNAIAILLDAIHLPVWLLLGIAVAMPLLCGGLLVICAKRLPSYAEPDAKLSCENLKSVPWLLIALVYGCCIIISITGLAVPELDIVRLEGSNVFLTIIYLVIMVAFFVWTVLFKRDEFSALWPFYSALVILGLLAFATFSFIDWDRSLKFLLATQDCLVVFLWVSIVEIIRTRNLPRAACFGLGTCPMLLATFVTSLIQPSHPVFSDGQNTTAVIIFTFSAALALTVLTIVLVVIDVTKRPHTPEQPGATVDETTLRLDALTESYGLSAREREILAFIVRGYSSKEIAGKLFISQNTVRTHTKSLYQKLLVHSKQELIKIYEAAFDGANTER